MTEVLPDVDYSPEQQILLGMFETPEFTRVLLEKLWDRTPSIVRDELLYKMPDNVRDDVALREIYYKEHLLGVHLQENLMTTS